MNEDYLDHWFEFIPDYFERERWIGAFGVTQHERARDYHDAFGGDLLAAATWHQHWWHLLGPTWSARLHRSGHDPRDLPVPLAARTTGRETRHAPSHRYRMWLYLAHPHLTAEDRNVIIDAAITPDELDRLVTTGTYNRDALTLLGALT